MFSLIISLIALFLGYMLYGKFVDRVFKPDLNKPTPAYTKADGVDYIAMPTWKILMIQFLNIAGTGPIFGAIMGAKFGPSCYLWIVLGSIFAGAVHDYFSGMISLRNGGISFAELVGKTLGTKTRRIMLVFTVIMMVLVGAVFVYSPAIILDGINPDIDTTLYWCITIMVYYLIATMLPVNKIIGKIYPIFAISMIFMAVALLVCLFVKWPSVPELWDGLKNTTENFGAEHQPIFPYLFVTVACGAISGFHGTQSPMMARCIKNEKNGRQVFYGSMILEGIVALIWAAVASYFFYGGGAAEMNSSTSLAAPSIVATISTSWLGTFGGILALLGVVAAPITTGDTALRSARLIIADAFFMEQKTNMSRLKICIPLFTITCLILWFNMSNEDGFNTIWQYFSWANQTLSVFTLWGLTVYISKKIKGLAYLLTLLPAATMTSICLTYICVVKIGLHLNESWIPFLGVSTFIISLGLYYLWRSKKMNSGITVDSLI